VEATDRLERIDRELVELSAVLRELSRSGPVTATAPRATRPVPAPPRPRPPSRPAPARAADVEAGPFVTLGAVEELHEQISRLPAVADVALRGFAGDRALLDVTLR
jgi:hypothetical protein